MTRSSRKRDPGPMRGPSIAAAKGRGVATTPFAGGTGVSTAGGRGPRAASTSRSTRSMLPGARGAGAAASGDDDFRAPPGARPLRVRAPEVPVAARFASSCLGAPMRRGLPTPGVHRAGIFALFPLPGGVRGALPQSLILRWRRRRRDPSAWGRGGRSGTGGRR
jgi:hypothetical protein